MQRIERKFNRLAILDNILLAANYRNKIAEYTRELITYPIPSINEEETISRLKGCDACISCWTKITKTVLEKSPNLKYVIVWSHWTKEVIAENDALACGVQISCLPGYANHSVSELVFIGISELVRKFSKLSHDAKRGTWLYEYVKTGTYKIDSIDEIKEEVLHGKTIGIIGLGRIGLQVAKMAKFGFGMNVVYYSRSRKLNEEAEIGIFYMDLHSLLRSSDIVTLHVSPDAPKSLIGGEELSLLKKGAVFVNTSVGHIVDQSTLISSLKKGDISAYLDVFDGLPPRKELEHLPNVIFTYRAGWYTRESVKKKSELLIENIQNILGYSLNDNNEMKST